MNRPIALLLALTAFACALPARAQDDKLKINLRVNYGAAYRDGTWVPVDIYIDNKSQDIEGYAEITLRETGGTMQSPRYRVPIDSPLHSIKRFRAVCFLQNAEVLRIELFHKNRNVTGGPLNTIVTPIGEKDFMCLVLDERPEDYGFLSVDLFRDSQEVIRVHRESLLHTQLGFLADQIECYTPFDMIVLGNIDPSLITPAHRALLEQYVTQGGTLAVCLGNNTGNYRGSWLEPLLGAGLGQTRVYNERALAALAFGESQISGTQPDIDGFATELTPAPQTDKRGSGDFVLETLRPHGSGVFAAFAVDAKSAVLQHSPAYHQLWKQLFLRSERRAPLNFGAAAQLAAAQLPAVAGVQLFPVSSVILYLVLYFVVGILANWLFWNYMKRREMAWVCLVLFSFAFTGYAMFFGTQGRAKHTELEYLETLRLPMNSATGELRVITGVLAAGSGSYSGTLPPGGALVADITSPFGNSYSRPGFRGNQFGSRPFIYTQDEPGRIDDLRIGASEMRFLEVTSSVTLSGGITGALNVERDGRITGELKNETGLAIQDAMLLAGGSSYRLEVTGTGWRIDWGLDRTSQRILQEAHNAPQYYGYRGNNMGWPNFKNSLRALLLTPADLQQAGVIYPGGGYGGGYGPGYGTGYGPISYNAPPPPRALNPNPPQGPGPTLPPCLVGWVDQSPLRRIEMDQRATENLAATLLVADVEVRNAFERSAESKAAARPLKVTTEGDIKLTPKAFPLEPEIETLSFEQWRNRTNLLRGTGPFTLTITLPSTPIGTPDYEIELRTYAANDPGAIYTAIQTSQPQLMPSYGGQQYPWEPQVLACGMSADRLVGLQRFESRSSGSGPPRPWILRIDPNTIAMCHGDSTLPLQLNVNVLDNGYMNSRQRNPQGAGEFHALYTVTATAYPVTQSQE